MYDFDVFSSDKKTLLTEIEERLNQKEIHKLY